MFKLIGRTTVFKIVKRTKYLGIATVTGVTLDGKFQTTARVVDVEFLNDET